ncbi:MAG TPA: histidine phosphatase family protein [Dehalococcoidia bacterium]|nr:histidine phosphatase family protein [Dehalococcoidia bacterium]
MELFMVRHGESDIPPGRIQKDYPLSELGRKQAERVGKRFAGMTIDHLITTPYRRCLETAQAIADNTGVEHVELPGLGAVDAGPLHDIPIVEIGERYPDLARPGTFDFSPAGGESPQSFSERITASFVEGIWDRYHNDQLTVVSVSHEETINAILFHMVGASFEGFHAFRIDHTSVTAVDVRFGKPRIRFTNDISHLGELPVGQSGKGRPAKA